MKVPLSPATILSESPENLAGGGTEEMIPVYQDIIINNVRKELSFSIRKHGVNVMQKSAPTGSWMTAVLGSMTAAMKAQRALSRAAIRSDIIKTESATTGLGCIYGITFPASHLGNVRTILNNAHIIVRHYLMGRGDIQ